MKDMMFYEIRVELKRDGIGMLVSKEFPRDQGK